MTSVEMTDTEWQQVLGILSMAPWRDANPLLMKIGEQLRAQQEDRHPSVGPSGSVAMGADGAAIDMKTN